MITKYRFGAISAPVEIVDSTGVVVPNAGIEFRITAGPAGLSITHIHVKAIRGNAVQSTAPIAILPEGVS